MMAPHIWPSETFILSELYWGPHCILSRLIYHYTKARVLRCFEATVPFILARVQLFHVAAANEWKSIDVRSLLTEGDEDIPVKCSTWAADGKRIICGARNAVLVSILRVNIRREHTKLNGDAALLWNKCTFKLV